MDMPTTLDTSATLHINGERLWQSLMDLTQIGNRLFP